MPDSTTDNPFHSPVELSQIRGKPADSLGLERRVAFGWGFAFVFVVLSAVPVDNYHSSIRAISTVVPLGRYYLELIRELFGLVPPSEAGWHYLYPRLFYHLSASLICGITGLVVHFVLDRMGLLKRFRVNLQTMLKQWRKRA
ncbi:hypothetical protein [Bremerella cremea]|uniref:hypothetical protein n=1 Tax=Bremerella cremea TaxID=1031537 RepID=UPI0011C02262|nr:hypothetical protein [Bremerella cremea]